MCVCRSGGGERAGGRLSADVCGLQREVRRPEEPKAAAHCSACNLHLTMPLSPWKHPHHLTPSAPYFGPSPPALLWRGSSACWDGGLNLLGLNMGPRRQASPPSLRENCAPFKLDTRRRGSSRGPEGGTHPPETQRHFTFVRYRPVESRWLRLAARKILV